MVQHKLKRLYIASLLLLVSIYTTSRFFNLQRNSSATSKEIEPTVNFMCYFKKQLFDDKISNDTLGYVTSEDVFMHFTFCKRPLKPAHFCAIEAASRACGTTMKLNVLFNKPLIFRTCPKTLINRILINYENVNFIRLQIEEYLSDTPFYGNAFKQFKNSPFSKRLQTYKIVEDMLKLATLYKYGGKVIDNDVIMTKLSTFNKWLITENGLVSMDAMSFSTKHDDIIKMTIM